MKNGKPNGVEGLYVQTRDRTKWILVAQKSADAKPKELTAFFKVWREREKLVKASRIRVIRSTAAVITTNKGE